MLRQIDLMGNTIDKVQMAIDRLRAFEPAEGYYLAFSGGKDSVVIKAIADMAGVKYDAHYNATTVDPPELVRFIKKEYPDVTIEKPEIPMIKLIAKKRMPPTRLFRYCCAYYKENTSSGRVTITGARWAESINRKRNQGLVVLMNKSTEVKRIAEENDADYRQTARGGIVMNDDNSESRRTVEMCYRTNKTLVNPIVDWTDEEVWEFIHGYKMPYCALYEEGWKRLGCVGCPMSGGESMIRELERWPAIRKRYMRAFADMMEGRKRDGLETTMWENAQDVMDWWTSKKRHWEERGQIEMEIEEMMGDGTD